MDLLDALAFARTNRWSVLTTLRRNGRPQLSNVGHLVGEDGLIRISVTAGLSGEHENWDAYRAAMVTERRAVVRLAPSHAYGMLQLPPRSGA